jgi:beta-xylosidase
MPRPRPGIGKLLSAIILGMTPALAVAPDRLRPALAADFPDPFLLRHGAQYLAYATNPAGGGVNVQMARSPDLARWQLLRDGGKLHDAMPLLPPWAKPGFTWAPEVVKTARGYVLYFTARDRRLGLQCIGAAVAAVPEGPFRSAAAAPLVCQPGLGGAIDPNIFRDADGRLILYFKNDGNNPVARKPTTIFAQRLSHDGLHPTGAPVAVLDADQAWEGNLVEAPTMVRHGGRYVLFFSANDYGWTEPRQRLSPYAIGYATCRSAIGPCSAAPENPILASRAAPDCLSGPGHQSVLQAGGRSVIAFHAWAAGSGCHRLASSRMLYVADLHWIDGKPRIGTNVQRSRHPNRHERLNQI